jgi:eukaryotic-like serine/threonine-protein kinase
LSTSPGSLDYGRFDELAEEFVERFRRGERPILQEYVDRLPGMADEIREMFPAMVEVECADDEARGLLVPPPPTGVPYLSQIGDYRILREVGRGGMGVVYEAEQVSLGRRVALKILPGHATGDRKTQERFRREAKSAARLHHTNIVPVFEVGHDRDVSFYAMQLIQGQGLDQVIEELRHLREPGLKSKVFGLASPDSLESRESFSKVRLSSSANQKKGDLARMAQSLLSGRLVTEFPGNPSSSSSRLTGVYPTEPDVDGGTPGRVPGQTTVPAPTPSSPPSGGSAVMPGGRPVSEVDTSGRSQPFFRSVAQIGRQASQGLAHAHARGIIHRDIKPSNLLLDTDGVVWITDFGLAKSDDDGLTATGDILGTLRYMAPERFRGLGDARADIYALGLTLYELLALRPAYDSSDRLRLVEKIKNEEPVRPRSIDTRVPRDLETIVLKAIEKEPERRYQTADAMAEDLRRFLADEPIRARQVSAAERYWRLARRNPGVAILGGVLTGVLVLATLTSLLAARRFYAQAEQQKTLAGASESARKSADQARAEETSARLKADQANTSLRIKEEELRRTVYATRSNLALAAWDSNKVGLLRSLLGLMRPSSDEHDLRGWEWRYLWGLDHEDRFTLRSSSETERFSDVVFSPDGQLLAGLEKKGRIHIWDRQTGQLRRTMGSPNQAEGASLSKGISALAFSPDGRSLAGPGPDYSLVLYSVDTGQQTLRLEGNPGAVQELAWSPNGQTLIASLSVHITRVWDTRDGHVILPLHGAHAAPIASVAYSPDGRTVATASYDHLVKLWKSGERTDPIAVLEGHTDEVRAVAFSPDGQRIASAGLDRTLRIWDAHTGAPLLVIWGHPSAIVSLAFFPDSTRVVTGSSDETVQVWDVVSGQQLRSFKGLTDEAVSVAVSSDGRDIAAAGGGTVRVWDATSRPRPLTLQSPSVLKYGGDVDCLAFSSDGSRLVSGHDDFAMRVWEMPTGRLLHLIKGHTNEIKCVAFSPDGRTIASASQDRTVRLWDAATGQHRLTFKGHTDEVFAVVFAPDGQTIFSGGKDRAIQAWDPATGVVRYVLPGHSDLVHDLAFSPDGQTLASAGYDQTCILWDLSTRRPRLTLRGQDAWIQTVAFSPDGHTLATASERLVQLWDTASGSPRGILKGHTEDVYGLAFSPDGRLASSGWDKTIRLWDPTSGQTVLVLTGHSANIRCLKFSPDGRTLASASSDRTLKLWEAAPASVLTAP